jgi:predicted ATPase
MAVSFRLRAPLCGRDHEIALLEDALSDTLTTSTPHAFALIGGAGLGKSRLLREFVADVRVRHPDTRVLLTQCREGGDPFGAIRALLRSRFGLVDGMDPETMRAALRDAVGEVIGDRRVGELVHFLGAFLDVALPDSPLAQVMSDDPEQVQKVGRSVLRRFLEADARKQPLLIALDDLHLAHPETASLLHYLIGSLSGAPVLFVVATRPELFDKHPAWLDLGGSALRFELGPLDLDSASLMVEHLLTPTGTPPDELVDEAVELAAGNPYLIEQIVRTFLEQGVLVPTSATHWDVNLERLEQVQLPLSVDDAIQARIAGLSSDERGLLEMAAALGGVFWVGALIALERAQTTPPRLFSDPKQDRQRIAGVLDELVARDYVMRLPDASIPGEIEYAFKHNLEREALHRYTSRVLLVRHHRVIAEWLELRSAEPNEEQHELMAQHFELGNVPARAAQHYLLAADRARARHAAARASGYYGRGLKLLGDGEAALRLRALERWGEALVRCGKSDEALEAYESMRVLAYQLDALNLAALAHARIGRAHRDGGSLDEALEHLDTAQALYEAVGDRVGLAAALDAMSAVHALRGHLEAAEHVLREAIATFEAARDERSLSHAYVSLGVLQRDTLRMDDALGSLTQALALQRKQQDDGGAAETLMHLGALNDRLGEHDHALSQWSDALQMAKRLDDRVREAAVLTCLGAAAYRRGAHDEALTKLTQADKLAATLGDRLQEADTLRSLAKARAMTGDFAGAIQAITRCLDLLERAQNRPQLAVALRTRAEIAASAPVDVSDIDPVAMFERASALHDELRQDLEHARTLLALADCLGKGSAEHVDGRERAIRAERLRQRARELMERHKGLTLRASVILPKRA